MLNLVEWLPNGSALHRSYNERVDLGWGPAEELLALVAELVDTGNIYLHNAHFKKPHPDHITLTRPWEIPERRQATVADLKRVFGGSVRYTGPPIPAETPAEGRGPLLGPDGRPASSSP